MLFLVRNPFKHRRYNNNMANLISKTLAEEPIKIPESPFWAVFKRFGRDEALAMVINIGGTALMTLISSNPLLLSIAGPIVEKIGFFPAHIKEAWDVYKTTPLERRKSLFTYVKKAFKGGTTSLIEDILIHDPFYILLMYFGLQIYAGTPAWLLSAASFVLAVIAVSGLEVGWTELQFFLFKKRLFKKGFEGEKYYEARFLISAKKKPQEVLKKLAKVFKLGNMTTLDYQDTYYENKLSDFSGRTPKLRLRYRTSRKKTFMQTAQITYTRAYQLAKGTLEQHRFFPINKEKLYFMLDQKMPKSIQEIKDKKVRVFLKKSLDDETPKKVNFSRTVAHNDELLISVDKIISNRPFYLMELKVYKNTDLLKEVMRHVMREYPVVQITHGKHDIV